MSCEGPPTQDTLMPRRTRYDRSQTCLKCKTARGNLVIKHAVYCSQCLPLMLIRKFRRSLSASLPPDPASPTPTPPDVLVALSGGPCSTVLLDLVYRCFSPISKGPEARPRATRRDVGRIRAVHVDWSGLGGKCLVQEIGEVVQGYVGVELVVVRGEEAFDPEWWARVGGGAKGDNVRIDPSDENLPFLPSSKGTSALTALQTYLSSLPTPSSLPPALSHLTRLLLSHTALALSSHLLLGTSLPRLSISLFECLAGGGGFAIGAEREEELLLLGGRVKVVRPLREWAAKEVGWWVWERRLRVVRPLGGKLTSVLSTGGKSIGKLTEDFIMGLERDYPSTVSTISRTCAKVVPSSAPSHICALCQRPAQREATLWKRNTAILTLPSSLSSPTPTPTLTATAIPLSDTLAPHLCYACHTNLTSRGGVGAGKRPTFTAMTAGEEEEEGMPMPVWVGRRVGREEMRGVVEEFLLDDDVEEVVG